MIAAIMKYVYQRYCLLSEGLWNFLNTSLNAVLNGYLFSMRKFFPRLDCTLFGGKNYLLSLLCYFGGHINSH